MDEQLCRGTMHHQRDKEVSEMLWKVVGCCRFLRLIMAWTSILHARQFLVQTSHDPNQCYSYAITIVFTSATGDQVNKYQNIGGDCIPSWSIWQQKALVVDIDGDGRFRFVACCYSGWENRNLCFTLKTGLGTQKGVRFKIPHSLCLFYTAVQSS